MFSRDRSWEPHARSTGDVVPLRTLRQHGAMPIAARHDDDAPKAGGGPAREVRGVLREEELRAIETTYPDGLTAVQIVDAFTSRGIKLSEG